MRALALVVAAYLCGALPSGVWFARLAGVDVRHSGSGNIGATNVARTAGMRLGIYTLLFDVAKGFLPVAAARLLVGDDWLIAFVGAAAFCGHLYSVFLRFDGGKGVATALGVTLAIAPAAAGVGVATFAAVAISTRYVSLASVLAAATLPATATLLRYPAAVSTLTVVLGTAVIVRHRSNLIRLWFGREPRFGSR